MNLNLREFLATGHFVGKVNEAFEQKKYFRDTPRFKNS